MTAVFLQDPFTASAFYATSVLAILVCFFRIARADRRQTHIILLALVVVSFGVTIAQVRGSLFSALFATFPLAAVIADLHRLHGRNPRDLKLAGLYAVITLASSSPAWALGGLVLENAFAPRVAGESTTSAAGCRSEQAVEPLRHEPPGLVAAPSNMGVGILRYTGQRVLAAPYHRDARGLTTVLRIETASPAEAGAMLRQAHITLLAYCPGDPETSIVGEAAPEGLLARISRGDIPDYLSPVPAGADRRVRFYRVLPATR